MNVVSRSAFQKTATPNNHCQHQSKSAHQATLRGHTIVWAADFSQPEPERVRTKAATAGGNQWKSSLDPGGLQTVQDNQNQLGVGSWESEITLRPEVKCGDLYDPTLQNRMLRSWRSSPVKGQRQANDHPVHMLLHQRPSL